MGCNTSKDTVKPPEFDQESKKQSEDIERDEENADLDQTNKQPEEKPPSARTITLKSSDDNETKNSEEAATKIQAAFRGHYTRKTMKKNEKEQNVESQPRKNSDAELEHAATKIQASFRGHMVRKQMEKEDQNKPSDLVPQEEENLDHIDLTDPELNQAATKIQASFRGHMSRKEEK